MSNSAMSNETDLDWLALNVHVWPAGDHQPWCYVYMVAGGAMKASGNFLDAVACPTMVTEDQWLSRRAELQNKPSWEDAPEWVGWLAQDKSGSWWFFRCHPKAMSEGWDSDSSAYHHSSWVDGEVLGDWRDTLEKRPEEFKQFTSIEDSQEKEMKRDNGWFELGELPPVGAECIFEPGDGKCYFNESELRAKGQKVTIIANTKYKKGDGSVAVFQWDLNDCCGVSSANQNGFLPIRTEREQLTSIIDGGKRVLAAPEAIADAILAAGFSLRDK